MKVTIDMENFEKVLENVLDENIEKIVIEETKKILHSNISTYVKDVIREIANKSIETYVNDYIKKATLKEDGGLYPREEENEELYPEEENEELYPREKEKNLYSSAIFKKRTR